MNWLLYFSVPWNSFHSVKLGSQRNLKSVLGLEKKKKKTIFVRQKIQTDFIRLTLFLFHIWIVKSLKICIKKEFNAG